MAKKEVTQEQFDQLREQLAQAENATKQVPLSAIKLMDDSISKGRILINDQPVPVSADFFKKLASTVKVSRALTNEMIKNEDGKVAVALMNGLKEYRSSHGGNDVLLIANPNSKEVIDICDPKRFRRMTNESVMDITERILNDNPNMSIETVDVNSRSGGIAINLLNNDEVGFAQAGPDEFFKFGFSIVQNSKDTFVEMYNQRLVCSNGLRVSLGQGAIGGNSQISFEEQFRLGGTSAEEIKIFLNRIEAMKKAGFVPGGFNASLNRALETRASLLEVENAMLTAQRMVHEDNPDLKKSYIDAIGRQYFHVHGDTLGRLTRGGVDPLKLNDKQKSFVRTGMSIWDVVNSMTFLGSNNSGFELENKAILKSQAGELFAKGVRDGYDLQYANLVQL